MKILVLNSGSSSIKYQLLDTNNDFAVVSKGLLERIGLKMGEFTHRYNGQKHCEQVAIPDHVTGIRMVLKALTDPEIGVIKHFDEIGAVGNRLAHGGQFFKESCLVTDEVIAKIKTLTELAPLHIPGNLAGIEAMREVLPNVPQVVVFDTAFHADLPPKAFLYGLPLEYYQRYGIRKYGFHGTSHGFVAEKGARLFLNRDWHDLKIITCHLGSGASIAAIDHGKSIDTTMGMTSLEGLVMGSRCGDVDPGVLTFLMEKENFDRAQMENVLYKKSGLVGISGGYQDMRDIRDGRDKGDEQCTYAFDVFAYKVRKYIGSYMAALNGCDLLVMTGGIGENAWFMRHAILQDLDFLGVKIDMPLNDATQGTDCLISTPDSRVAVAVVTTDEERVIANETYHLCH